MLPAQPNQSLIDGLACLHALAVSPEPVGSRELARMLNLEPTRTNRLLKTLAHLGLAEQNSKRKYQAGPAIHVLAVESLQRSGIIDRALDALTPLQHPGHVVAMGVLWQGLVCYLIHRHPQRSASEALRHRPVQAHQSGLGVALLAKKPEEEIRAMYSGATAPRLDGRGGLLQQLTEVRTRGYALVPAEDDKRSLAIAIDGSSHAAIGVSGHFADTETDALVTQLHEAARIIDNVEQQPSAD